MAASEYHLQAETHQIIGCSMEVINELGEVGLIVNFKYAKLEWKRVVQSQQEAALKQRMTICVHLRFTRAMIQQRPC